MSLSCCIHTSGAYVLEVPTRLASAWQHPERPGGPKWPPAITPLLNIYKDSQPKSPRAPWRPWVPPVSRPLVRIHYDCQPRRSGAPWGLWVVSRS